MDLTGSPIQQAVVTASAMLATVIGVLVLLRRGHWLTTLLFASAFLALGALQAGTLGLLHAESDGAARAWSTYLLGVSALASWLWLVLSVVLARAEPMQHVRQALAYLTLALIACVTLFVLAGSPYVVSEVKRIGHDPMLVLGGLGKVYLMYLVVVLVAVLMNLESTLRTAPASDQRRLRALVVAFVIGGLSTLVLISAGLLYGGLRASWLATNSVPLFVAGVATSFALARQRLSDMSVPVARPVIYYSSVSLTLAGLFLLSMAALSKVLPAMTPQWKQVVSLGFYVLVAGGGLVLTVSPAANRAIKRFIDRNFYANRYDYRREWDRVNRAITPAARPEDVCRQVESLMRSLFDTERVVVHLRDDHGNYPCAYTSPGIPLPPLLTPLRSDNPLVSGLTRLRVPFVFREIANDLDLLPAAAENRPILQAISAAVCAPLQVGDEMVGLLWLSEKRTDEDYSHEDIEFLTAMSRQLAASLWFARLADQLAETRQFESLHRLSIYVLHDIKNQVSGLSLMLENARRHMSDPDFQRDAMRVVERTVEGLRQLMDHVGSVSRPAVVRPQPVRIRQLVEEAAAAAGLHEGEREGIHFSISCHGPERALLDGEQMVRVVTNLLVNAREALDGPGDIRLDATVESDGDVPAMFVLRVRDTGRGMTEEFVRRDLFRPFATTKPAGLGIGLAQSKAIVEGHGGAIHVDSRPGRGTSFEVRVPLRPAPRGDELEATA
jgi:putative PEP-CTERM system histidine kinase